MKLFLMRHAEAKTLNHQDDRLRELTQKGIKKDEEEAAFLQKYKIDKILVSNAVRTIQTGEIIYNKINSTKFEICPELYASTSEDIIELISRQQDQDKNTGLIHSVTVTVALQSANLPKIFFLLINVKYR